MTFYKLHSRPVSVVYIVSDISHTVQPQSYSLHIDVSVYFKVDQEYLK